MENDLLKNIIGVWMLDGNPMDKTGRHSGFQSNVDYIHKDRNIVGNFNGSNSEINVGNIDLVDKSFSFSFWIANTRTGTGESWFLGQGVDILNRGLHIGKIPNGKIRLAFYGNDVESTTNMATNGTFEHWVFTYNSSTKSQKIYLAGILNNSRTATGNYIGTGDLFIGKNTQGSPYYLGQIGAVIYWNREITEAEVKYINRQGLGYNPLTPNKILSPFFYTTPPTSPTVTTSPVTNIATNSGLGNGNVTDDGGATITERGICWNTSPNPTTADSKSVATGTTGAFSADIHSLTTGTTYYVRAYATNSVGTSYGSEVTFSPSQVSLQQESGGFIKQENGRTFIF